MVSLNFLASSSASACGMLNRERAVKASGQSVKEPNDHGAKSSPLAMIVHAKGLGADVVKCEGRGHQLLEILANARVEVVKIQEEVAEGVARHREQMAVAYLSRIEHPEFAEGLHDVVSRKTEGLASRSDELVGDLIWILAHPAELFDLHPGFGFDLVPLALTEPGADQLLDRRVHHAI